MTPKEEILYRIKEISRIYESDVNGNGFLQSLIDEYKSKLGEVRVPLMEIIQNWFQQTKYPDSSFGLALVQEFQLKELLPDVYKLRANVLKSNLNPRIAYLMEIDRVIESFN